ncbi:hypothetical protein MCEMAEM4_03367 [Burkholderiaceae bacterium]
MATCASENIEVLCFEVNYLIAIFACLVEVNLEVAHRGQEVKEAHKTNRRGLGCERGPGARWIALGRQHGQTEINVVQLQANGV